MNFVGILVTYVCCWTRGYIDKYKWNRWSKCWCLETTNYRDLTKVSNGPWPSRNPQRLLEVDLLLLIIINDKRDQWFWFLCLHFQLRVKSELQEFRFDLKNCTVIISDNQMSCSYCNHPTSAGLNIKEHLINIWRPDWSIFMIDKVCENMASGG